MSDKREATRYKIQQFVKLDFMKETFLYAESMDISLKGIRCRLNRNLTPGQRVFLMLNLGTPVEPLMINQESTVVWCKPESQEWWDCGLAFDPLRDEDAKMITEALGASAQENIL